MNEVFRNYLESNIVPRAFPFEIGKKKPRKEVDLESSLQLSPDHEDKHFVTQVFLESFIQRDRDMIGQIKSDRRLPFSHLHLRIFEINLLGIAQFLRFGLAGKRSQQDRDNFNLPFVLNIVDKISKILLHNVKSQMTEGILTKYICASAELIVQMLQAKQVDVHPLVQSL